jgi:hypothetical protein
MILDEQTKDELASGKFADQRRGSFGTSVSSASPPEAAAVKSAPAQPVRRRPAPPRPTARQAPRPAWTKSQEKLALLYNQQGLRPEEIAQKLRLSTYTVTQIILGSRNRGKL